MRNPFSRLIAFVAVFSAVSAPLRAQTDTTLKLSTTNPAAAAEFRAGVDDYQNLSFESASAHFKAAVTADPKFGLARVLYAGTTFGLDSAQLDRELSRGVADAAHATNKELILASGYREAALGHSDAANALFRAATQLMPNDRLVAFAATGGVFSANLPAAKDLVARYPDYALGYNSLAYLSWNAGDRAAALAAAKRQVELNPTAPNPHDTYAELLQWNGDFANAAAHYKQATTLTPRFPEAYAGLAEVAALQGQYDQARSYLNQAIANAWTPQQKLGYMRQIIGTYVLQGAAADVLTRQFDAAIAEAKAEKDTRTTAILYSQLATVQANAANAGAAHESIARAKAASADVPWHVHYYAAMAHGLMKHWSPAGQELAALKDQEAREQSVPGDFLAALAGYQLTQQGKPADALPILMAADTTNVLVMNRIAEAHAALGHTAEAAAWNARVNANYALNLGDFTNVNSRRRARQATK
ncbi:MAG TPA: tetratricopeptide repeat protein [Gemmatimonadaceae bacterium]|nr:tetratricopeptide repeat protein [Gemmatimonadaceae bacterium]